MLTLKPHLWSHHLSAVSLPVSDLFLEIETMVGSKVVNVVYGAIGNCSALSRMLLRLWLFSFVSLFENINNAVQLYCYCLSIFDEKNS